MGPASGGGGGGQYQGRRGVGRFGGFDWYLTRSNSLTGVVGGLSLLGPKIRNGWWASGVLDLDYGVVLGN